MPKSIGIFVDTNNFYFCCGRKFRKKFNYRALVEFAASLGTVEKAAAYGRDPRRAKTFIHVLKKAGYDIRYMESSRKHLPNLGMLMVQDIMTQVDRFDTIIIGTSSKDFISLIRWLQSKGKTVVVVGCMTNKALRAVADTTIEIPASMLEDNSVVVISPNASEDGE